MPPPPTSITRPMFGISRTRSPMTSILSSPSLLSLTSNYYSTSSTSSTHRLTCRCVTCLRSRNQSCKYSTTTTTSSTTTLSGTPTTNETSTNSPHHQQTFLTIPFNNHSLSRQDPVITTNLMGPINPTILKKESNPPTDLDSLPLHLLNMRKPKGLPIKKFIKRIKRLDPNRHNISQKPIQSLLYAFESGSLHGLLQLSPDIFGIQTVRHDLLHRAVLFERNRLRQGTHATKELGQLRGSSRKFAPQKGRGKARVGSIRAPHLRGGYKVFGPKPMDHSTNLQRKVYALAIRNALSSKILANQVIIVDSLSLPDIPNILETETDSNEEIQSGNKRALVKELLSRLTTLPNRLVFDPRHPSKSKSIYFIYGNEEPETNLISAVNSINTHHVQRLLKQNQTRLRTKTLPQKLSRKLRKKYRMTAVSARMLEVYQILRHEVVVMDKAAAELLEYLYEPGLKRWYA